MGNWTPTIASGNYEYSTQSGYYLFIDKFKLVFWDMVVSKINTVGTNALTISGVPFYSPYPYGIVFSFNLSNNMNGYVYMTSIYSLGVSYSAINSGTRIAGSVSYQS